MGALIDGRDFSLKAIICLKGNMKGFENVGEQVGVR